MKRKIAAFMTALTLASGLSACGGKAPVSIDVTDATRIEETEVAVPEEAGETEEVTIQGGTEEDMIQKEIEKVQSALGEMPYYGDTANCKMSAEQATAFAQLIADGLAGDFSFRDGYDERFDILTWGESFQTYDINKGEVWEKDRSNVMLADFSGEGVPYIYVYSSTNSELYPSYEIYGWTDNEAKLVIDTDTENTSIACEIYDFYEDENDRHKIKMFLNSSWGMGEDLIVYSFVNGTMEERIIREDREEQDGSWRVTENGVEKVYTAKEYNAISSERIQEKEHIHTLPYTCFYDMTPCTLEEMVDYLNAYAAVMSDGKSVPVEIKEADIVKHEGTGIITKGEVPQWKIDVLDVLRKYMSGEISIGVGNADSVIYAEGTGEAGGEGFYFGMTDLNNDGIQELLISGKDSTGANTQIHFPPSYECLKNICGINNENGTYLVSEGSVCTEEHLYVYDGTSFSLLSSLEGDWDSEDGGPYTLTENGIAREISKEEFEAVLNDWHSRHTDIADSADTYLDIENIENKIHVKIRVQNSGEWFVADAG